MLPIIAQHRGALTSVGGGWLTGMSNALRKQSDISLFVTFPASSVERIDGAFDGLSYCSFLTTDVTRYRSSLKNDFVEIITREKPDVIHIFGTEFPHTLSAIEACEELEILNRTVISIQGLTSVLGKPSSYYAALPKRTVNGRTIRDLIKRDNVKQQAKKMRCRGEYEIKAIEKAFHIIGRTDWDNENTHAINPQVNYHFCNETLRDAFYEGVWNYDDCEKYSIFVSQCSYPIKGFHMMLDAMRNIVKKYPDAHLYTTGPNLMTEGFLTDQRKTYYSLYLKKKIKQYGLCDKVTFLGFLSEEKMKERMVKSHVFVSPSSMENSPNSLGEAMLLGVPCVSSDVGGVKNMLNHNMEGLVYPFHDSYTLACCVDEIFASRNLAERFSLNAKAHAEKTHSREINLKTLVNIYNKISTDGKNE